MATPDGIRIEDGQLDWSQGINSAVVTTIQSQRTPNGIKRNQHAWLTNSTVRWGGTWPRTGWQYLTTLHDSTARWMFGSMYQPDFDGFPYLIYQIGGHVYQCRVDTDNSIHDLSQQFGLFNPTTPDRTFWAQGQQFLFCQAGDYGKGGPVIPGTTDAAGNTLPLIWDGVKLFRSKGITNPAVAPGTPGVNQLPAATCMVYYQLRLWYATGGVVNAGDVVFGTSGTGAYGFKDSIWNITENPLVLGGDGFAVPSQAGNIRALNYTASLDATLGQGPLFIFTRKQIYQLIVPPTRTAWIAANNNNQPALTIAQVVNGSVNDTSVVAINGDLYYQTIEPGIRSLFSAIRYYQQPGQVPISRNEQRLIQFNDRSLLHFSSGIEFDNRLIQTALPTSTPQGVIHKALIPLDFDIISTLEDRLPPAWEGGYEGLNVLQLFTGDFGGRQRAFAAVVSSVDASIQLWEITNFAQSDFNTSGESRITWIIETPAYTFGDETQYKELDNAEFGFDRIYGTVFFKLQYRQDSNPCWIDWHAWSVCAARNSLESTGVQYPFQQYCEADQNPMVMPKAPAFGCAPLNKRPTNLGYQFQLRLTITGFCRLRSIRVFAMPRERQQYSGLVCPPNQNQVLLPLPPTPPQPPPGQSGDVLGNPLTGDIFGDASGNQLGIP